MSIPKANEISVGEVASISDTRRHIRGSSLLLVGRLLSKVINFGVQVLIVRYLSKGDFGIFAYALGIVAMVQAFVTFGLDHTVTRFLAIYQEQGDDPRMFGTLLMVVGTITILGITTVCGFYALEAALGTSVFENARVRSVVFILVLLGPLQALDDVMIGLFAVFAKARAIFFRKHVVAPLLKLVVVITLVGSGSGVLFLAAGYVAAQLAGLVIYTLLLVRVLAARGLLRRFQYNSIEVPWRSIFAFTIPLFSTDLVYVTIHSTNTVMLQHFSDAEQVASLRAVLPAAMLNQLVFSSFATLFTPSAARMFAREDFQGINNLYWKTAMWVAFLSFPIFALTFSLAQPFTTVVYGAQYAGSGLILSLLAAGYYFNVALGFNGLTLRVYGRVAYIVKINVVTIVANLALNLWLIPLYGALGAAIATSSTLVVHNLLKQFGLALGTGINIFDRRYITAYATISIAALALMGLQSGMQLPLPVSVMFAVVVSVLMLILNHRLLDVPAMLPEVMRVPLAGRLLSNSKDRN